MRVLIKASKPKARITGWSAIFVDSPTRRCVTEINRDYSNIFTQGLPIPPQIPQRNNNLNRSLFPRALQSKNGVHEKVVTSQLPI